jgi:hypothetical protein
MLRVLSLICVLVFTLPAFAQDVAKNDPPKAGAKKDEKPDPMAVTAEESALLQPVIADFTKWQGKLNAAHKALVETRAASSPEVEALKVTIAAKDIREALEGLSATRADYQKWEKEMKDKRNCQDCKFDEQSGKFVKPAPAPKQ